MTMSFLLASSLAWVLPGPGAPANSAVEPGAVVDPGEALYREVGLEGTLAREAFLAGHRSMLDHGVETGVLAVADMSQPSTVPRLVIIDLEAKRLVLRSWVAHGQGSGGLLAERFSNVEGSHMTSLGLYRVGAEIVSPKHGPALLLEGLDRGVNDRARAREIIIHGADYVSEAFIARNGRLGRSWGCPAVPRDDMTDVIEWLADGSLLFVYGD